MPGFPLSANDNDYHFTLISYIRLNENDNAYHFPGNVKKPLIIKDLGAAKRTRQKAGGQLPFVGQESTDERSLTAIADRLIIQSSIGNQKCVTTSNSFCSTVIFHRAFRLMLGRVDSFCIVTKSALAHTIAPCYFAWASNGITKMRKHFQLKPRNPVAVALQSKRNTTHGKSRKAERRAAKVALRREYF